MPALQGIHLLLLLVLVPFNKQTWIDGKLPRPHSEYEKNLPALPNPGNMQFFFPHFCQALAFIGCAVLVKCCEVSADFKSAM